MILPKQHAATRNRRHMTVIVSQITSNFTVYSIVCSVCTKENIKYLRYWSYRWGFPSQRAGNAERVSMVWRHHEGYIQMRVTSHIAKTLGSTCWTSNGIDPTILCRIDDINPTQDCWIDAKSMSNRKYPLHHLYVIWCIVGYGAGALWDLCSRSIGSMPLVIFYLASGQSINWTSASEAITGPDSI